MGTKQKMRRHTVPSNGPTTGGNANWDSPQISSRLKWLTIVLKNNERNRPFPSFLVRLFQN